MLFKFFDPAILMILIQVLIQVVEVISLAAVFCLLCSCTLWMYDYNIHVLHNKFTQCIKLKEDLNGA